MKESGILMPVSALPSRTGIGELGAQTREFLKLLRENKVTIWQILPLNPVGYGNSPYQPYSSFAGDPVYISLDDVYEEGLLLERPPALRQNAKTVDYEGVRSWKEEYLRSAFLKFSSNADAEQKDAGYQEFEKQKWVHNYGVFQAFRKKNGGLCWNEWTEEERNWPENQYPLSDELEEEARYQIFVQYLFHHQWMKIKRTANDLGIRIMGDVPFYVGLDSADVWAGKDNFLLDTDGRPVFIAGVPPDYFSKRGSAGEIQSTIGRSFRRMTINSGWRESDAAARCLIWFASIISGRLIHFGRFRHLVRLRLKENGWKRRDMR